MAGTETELYRQQVTPDMAVTADGRAVVLEVSGCEDCGNFVRVTLAHVAAFFEAVEAARDANRAAGVAAEAVRAAEVGTARRARGLLTQTEAVDALAARGMPRSDAVNLTFTAHAADGQPVPAVACETALAVRVLNGYWIIDPPQQA